jgi:hypothetical protein
MRARDRAEYAAHGEHLGVVSGARRFSGPNWQLATVDFATGQLHANERERTLLVAKLADTMPDDVAIDVMCDHGALAVKDTAGRWRFHFTRVIETKQFVTVVHRSRPHRDIRIYRRLDAQASPAYPETAVPLSKLTEASRNERRHRRLKF